MRSTLTPYSRSCLIEKAEVLQPPAFVNSVLTQHHLLGDLTRLPCACLTICSSCVIYREAFTPSRSLSLPNLSSGYRSSSLHLVNFRSSIASIARLRTFIPNLLVHRSSQQNITAIISSSLIIPNNNLHENIANEIYHFLLPFIYTRTNNCSYNLRPTDDSFIHCLTPLLIGSHTFFNHDALYRTHDWIKHSSKQLYNIYICGQVSKSESWQTSWVVLTLVHTYIVSVTCICVCIHIYRRRIYTESLSLSLFLFPPSSRFPCDKILSTSLRLHDLCFSSALVLCLYAYQGGWLIRKRKWDEERKTLEREKERDREWTLSRI